MQHHRRYAEGKADCRLDKESIHVACDASLRRLQTDYIDLYQLHWPDRYCPGFGTAVYDPAKERDAVPIRETVRFSEQASVLSLFGITVFVLLAQKRKRIWRARRRKWNVVVRCPV